MPENRKLNFIPDFNLLIREANRKVYGIKVLEKSGRGCLTSLKKNCFIHLLRDELKGVYILKGVHFKIPKKVRKRII